MYQAAMWVCVVAQIVTLTLTQTTPPPEMELFVNVDGLLDETLSHPVIILTFPCSPRVKSARYLKQDTFEHFMVELEDFAREDIATITPYAGDVFGTVDVKLVFFPYVEADVINAARDRLQQVAVSSPCGNSELNEVVMFYTEPEIAAEQVC